METKEKINSKSEEIILYTTGCVLCKALKRKLDVAGVIYTNNSDEETMIAKGFDTVPVLEVDGKIYNYKNALQWVETREGRNG